MTGSLQNFKLPEAERYFAAANTPSFLVRKLRSDSSVRSLQARYGSSAILTELKRILKKNPKTLSELVRPYVYLVALSFDFDISGLAEAAKLTTSRFSWYQEIAQGLLASQVPVQFNTVSFPPRLKTPEFDPATNSTNVLSIRGGS
jgi:hypothetical protein